MTYTTLQGQYGAAAMMLAAAGLSCSVPRAYQSPRTTPRGEISHSIAFETGQGFYEMEDREQDALVAPEGQNPATYTLRVGLAERWEAAGSAGLGLWASEVKWNFLRSVVLDAALAPRVQYFEPLVFGGSPGRLLTISFPLPLGLNVNRELSLIAAPTLAYAAGYEAIESHEEEEGATIPPAEHQRGLVGALALDLEARPYSRLAFHPGVTLYRNFVSGEVRWQVGIAVNFGRLPGYGDVPP